MNYRFHAPMFASVVFCNVVFCAAVFAQLPTPELHGFTQVVFTVGTESIIRGHGLNLDEPRAVSTDHARVTANCVQVSSSLLSDDQQPNGEIRIGVESDAEPGLVPVRLRGRFGISNPVNLLVVRSPVHVINEDLSNIAAAHTVEPGNVYDVKLYPAKRSCFQIDLKQGSHLRLAAYVDPSHSDAIVGCVVFDPDGREVDRTRSTRHWPAEADMIAETSGRYTIAFNDFLNLGGDLYRFVFELGVGNASPTPELELDRLLRPDLSNSPSPPVYNSIAKAYAFETELPISNERSSPIPLSKLIDLSNGSAEIDFEAAAGQRLIIEARSQQLEQLTDPRIDVFYLKPNAALPIHVAENDDRPFVGSNDLRVRGLDPLLDWTVSETGRYRIRISDNGSGQIQSGSRSAYVSVVPYEPRFALLASPVFPHKDRSTARPFGGRLLKGGRYAVRVIALRQPGFNSAIEIDAQGLPDFLHSEPVVLAANMNESVLTVVASDDAEAWAGAVQIVGHPLDKNQRPMELHAVEAHYATVVNGKTPHRNAIETVLADHLEIALTAEDLAPMAIQLGGADPIEVAQGGTVKIPTSLTRRSGGVNDCVLRAQNLPPKIKQGDVTIPKDKSSIEFDLKITSDLQPGPYSFWMQAETKVKWRRNPQALRRAELYLHQLNTALETGMPTIEKTKLEVAVKAQSAIVAQLKKQTAEKDITVWVPTNPIRINVVPAKSG